MTTANMLLCTSIPTTLYDVSMAPLCLTPTGRACVELVKHGHVLPPLPKRQGGVHSFVQMHAPDQTADRLQLPHCSNDLGRGATSYCGAKLAPIFTTICGP